VTKGTRIPRRDVSGDSNISGQLFLDFSCGWEREYVGWLIFLPKATVQQIHFAAGGQQHIHSACESGGYPRALHETTESYLCQIRNAPLKDDHFAANCTSLVI
jgi:hypothetical protein